MVDNIVKFPGVEDIMDNDFDAVGVRVDINDVLEGAKGVGLEDLILIGRNAEGQLYFASTQEKASSILYDLESAKHVLMNATFVFGD